MKESIGEFLENFTIFDIWLFCTAFDCRLELNDGRIADVTCTSRRHT